MSTDVLEATALRSIVSARPHAACYHCGTGCGDDSISLGDYIFCCAGCRTVFQILEENGLQQFYELVKSPGIRMPAAAQAAAFDYLNEESIRRSLLDFSDGKTARVTFHIPAIHCVACVWLLENLFRLNPGIGHAEVDFPHRKLALSFAEEKISLAGVVTLLTSLGYEPALNLKALERQPPDPTMRRLVQRIGLAGFAFGNIMLLSFPSYLGLNPATEQTLKSFFGYISLLIALPVLLFSASDYWRAAWTCFRQRIITIELPIALGIAALFTQSAFDILARRGEGYLDSFSGLIFLLLCGRWFQRKTYATLAFDRDYKSYFPLSVIRKSGAAESPTPITSLNVGDLIVVRNGELIPADAVLRSDAAMLDYSFVTGESAPVERRGGDYLYAGGRQAGGAIEVEIVKNVSQSYLTSLWNSDAFHKAGGQDLNSLLNRAGRYFTYAVLIIAGSVALVWTFVNPAMTIRAFSSVLLVACPCALALAAPFTLGTAMRIFGRHRFYLRNTSVVEAMAKTTALVFDKTGTLTSSAATHVQHEGGALTETELQSVATVARQSAHPLCRAIGDMRAGCSVVTGFREVVGCGVMGVVGGVVVQLGSQAWLRQEGDEATAVYVALDGVPRGRFVVSSAYRPELPGLIGKLAGHYDLSVISGDNERDKAALANLCGQNARILFRQSPHEKMAFVSRLKDRGQKVMMLGDGLNDAGALKQSAVGVAVTEDIAQFSPACDAILDARALGMLPDFIRFSRATMNVLRAAFAISLAYNAVGLSFAAAGWLSPMVSAVLMPLSSFSVIGFSVLATQWTARRAGLR